ncbi:MAG: type I-MYXAN CRISPR-associated protein Cas5/Cmx5/DevS [Candidatus Riflebacteria bacterium]|nr:type I-MYXAN CRISPR-associated protein Cas5/Cmx5/DevS [Candidatus Riflebacteria bacterium]
MSESSFLSLQVEVPICSFRKGWAREFLETEDLPPPATVFGFLLSLAGEEERELWQGVRIAYARLRKPERSVVLRTIWRVKNAKAPPGSGNNRRPDFQELLTDLGIGVWVYSPELVPRLRNALNGPERERFGGLSLGESRDLVNDIIVDPRLESLENPEWLIADLEGTHSLPIWVDHVGSRGTVRKQFRLLALPWERPPEYDPRWIEIRAPETTKVDTSARRKSQKKSKLNEEVSEDKEPSNDS